MKRTYGSIKRDIGYFFVFLILFLVFFLYKSYILNNNSVFFLIIEIAIFILFIVSIFKIRFGFYVFIFLIPLVNSLPEIMAGKNFMLIMLLFFPVFLAFIIDMHKGQYGLDEDFIRQKQGFYDMTLNGIIVTIAILFSVSFIITILRYSNFYPFFTSNYHNLFINIKSITSDFAIPWVMDSYFNYIMGFAVLIVAYKLINKMADILDILNIIIFSTFFSSLFIIYQRFFNPYIGVPGIWADSGRFNSTFSDPNGLGAFCVILFPIFFIMIFIYKNIFKKILYSILLLFFLILIYFSGSRSSLIGIFFSLAVFIIYFLIIAIKKIPMLNFKRKIKIILVIVICVIIFLSGILAIFINDSSRNKILKNGVVARTMDTFSTFKLHLEKDGLTEALKSVSNYRYIYWERAYQMGRDYPFSGVGIGSYILELPDYNYRYNRGFQNEDYAGNYYLQVFAEFGFTGLILIIAFFAIIIVRYAIYIKRNRRKISADNRKNYLILALFLSFLSMILILIFGPHTNFAEVQIAFYLIIGLILSFIRINDNSFLIVRKNIYVNLVYINRDILSKYLFGRKQKIIQAICVILIISAFTYKFTEASSTNLSLYIKENICGWSDVGVNNNFGLYAEEGYGEDSPRWTMKEAHVNYKKEGKRFSIPIKALNPDIYENPLYVKIYIDYNLITEIRLNDDKWHKITIKLPQNDMGRFNATLMCSRDWSPSESGISDDERRLGVMIGAIEFKD